MLPVTLRFVPDCRQERRGRWILAIAAQRAAIAVWSPELNDNGNSLVGSMVLEALATRMGWSIFG